MSRHFDFVVIGGGSAGYAAARTAASAGKTVAIVDSGPELGGLCILRGCMPSKTLLYVADILHHARNSAKLGLRIPKADADMAAVQARKKEIIKDFADYRAGQLLSDRFTLIRKNVRFVSGEALETEDGERIEAGHFVIATGSVVNWPKVPGLEPGKVWISDDVLDLDFLPESVVVLGGGVVACELAQMLNRLGTKVTLVQRSGRILKECSPEAAAVVEKAFRDEGMEIYTGTRLLAIEEEGGARLVRFEHHGQVKEVQAAHVLNAMGRSPASDGLNLDAACVELNEQGRVVVDEFQRTSNHRISAAGDVCGPVEIVHVAIMQGELAVEAALGKKVHPIDYDKVTRVVFTDPQVASAGISKEELDERDIAYSEASYPFDDHGKSILMEAKYGYVRAFANAEGRLLGAECVGRDAGELIHPMALALALNADCRSMLRAHWYHPTLSEIWTYPLEDLA